MTGEQKPGGLSTTATNTMRSLDALCRIPSSSPAKPAEARIRELVDQLLKTERDYSELRQSYDAVVAKLTIERGHGDKQYRRATAAEAKLARAVEGLPDLSAVIAWLDNGCDPKHAADELRIYKARIDHALQQEGG